MDINFMSYLFYKILIYLVDKIFVKWKLKCFKWNIYYLVYNLFKLGNFLLKM